MFLVLYTLHTIIEDDNLNLGIAMIACKTLPTTVLRYKNGTRYLKECGFE